MYGNTASKERSNPNSNPAASYKSQEITDQANLGYAVQEPTQRQLSNTDLDYVTKQQPNPEQRSQLNSDYNSEQNQQRLSNNSEYNSDYSRQRLQPNTDYSADQTRQRLPPNQEQNPPRMQVSSDYNPEPNQQRMQLNSDFTHRSNMEQSNVSYSDMQQRTQPTQPMQSMQSMQPNSDYARTRVNLEQTQSKSSKERTAKDARTPSKTHNNTDFVRSNPKPNPNFVLPPQMRPAVGPPQPRPPFAGARPMVGVGPRPPMPPNMAVRPMPPPLRPTDSKNNLIMGPPMPRPGMPPQLNMQQARLPNSGGPLSPPGQGPPRPQGGFPWAPAAGGAAGAPPGGMPRLPQNMQRPPPPTFARPMQPGQPGQPMQAPFRPPLYNQQLPPQQLQQQQPLQQPQQQQQLRPPSASSDDDDVIMGQAVTPLKSYNMKGDPMGSPLLEETEPPFDATSPTEAPFKSGASKGDNDSGVDESTQEKDRNGPNSPSSPVKTPTSSSSKPDKSGISRPPSATPSNKSASKSRSASKNRLLLKTPEPEPAKKVPMNKVQVGHAPSPNLKAVRSKIGSLDNTTYKPGGGNVKIESKKLDIKAGSRIEAKNDKYMPKGGEKKIVTTKLQWNAKSKIGSLENAAHKPGGGDKKIETLKMDFKDKAKSKVNSKDNVKHQPGGGDIKIQSQKIEIKAQSKVGSLDNVKHKPGGGEKKIFDDKDYLKNVEHSVALTTPPTQYWKAPRIQRATTLTSSMSLPAECLVLSVSMPSLNSEPKRPKSAGAKKKPGQAMHPKPFRLY